MSDGREGKYMTNSDFSKTALSEAVVKLQEKKELAASVGPDWYEPGRMENLDQYLGLFNESTQTITLRTESKGLRYDERTPRLDYLSIGDPVQLVREPENPFNSNNIRILSENGEDLGNMSADLCNAIAPLLDAGSLFIRSSSVSYIERIRDRSRYARQGVLFVEITMELK
jgi:hypothetical protein